MDQTIWKSVPVRIASPRQSIADIAEFFKENVYNEVIGYHFAFVLTDVFWTQFHFAGLNIISTLDKRRIEH